MTGRPTDVKGTFAFYVLESMLTAKKDIPVNDNLTEEEKKQRYALRDKKLKNGDGTNLPEFEYANDAGTYVEFKGYIKYKYNTTQELSADVKFMVHLGGGVNDVNNYSNIRNVHYTYNVTINSINDILIEVTDDNERRPGVEGDVALANKIVDLDAYYNVLSLDFGYPAIDNTLTWDVSTPFSKGNAIANPKDYEWVLFRIGKKSANLYNDVFNTYLGDGKDKRYSEELNDANISDFFTQYMSDIDNGVDKMLDVRQLVAVLKESKRRAGLIPKERSLFDNGDNIRFTTFVNEYYYNFNPESTSETVEGGLWKQFVNKNIRILNILSRYQQSNDMQSSKSMAQYSIRQASIQTMYNLKSTETFTGWGSQYYPNEAVIGRTFAIDETSVNVNTDGQRNGRQNFVNFFPNNSAWSTYLNYDTWQNKTDYDYVKYKCMNRNRDMNGDGIIQQNEVQWYLASINQLTNLWIGEDSFSAVSNLYQFSTWELTKQHYVSSSVFYQNNPEVLWASEGSSIGRLNESGASQIYYRCVRNLGIPNNASTDITPDPIYIYTAPKRDRVWENIQYIYTNYNGFIDLSRLDAKSIRGFYTVEELPDHELRDDRGFNKPYIKFEIMYDTYGSGLSWEAVRSRSQPGGNNPICPTGWRVPTQRELSIMYSLMEDFGSDGIFTASYPFLKAWPISEHFCRTGFNKSWAIDRPGFAVTNNGGVLYMLSGVDGGNGGVRCIRDVKK